MTKTIDRQEWLSQQESMDSLTPWQREFVEVLHHQGDVSMGEAIDLNAKLHELAAQHLVVCGWGLDSQSSSEPQVEAQFALLGRLEQQITDLIEPVPGVLGTKFVYDPRGTTVGLVFASGACNSMTGSYKIPIDPARVAQLRQLPLAA